MNITPHYPPRLHHRIDLPSSKSISNRALLLCALSGPGAGVEHLSSCDDTRAMWMALRERPEIIDIGAAGTAMRFLTAYFAVCSDESHVLTGTERMLQRPIGQLVDALRELGADISYLGREGYPPLRIRGKRLRGGRLRLSASVSSQFISALLLISPTMPGGLVIDLEGEVTSRPYIDMTLRVMRDFGAQVTWDGTQTIRTCGGGLRDSLSYPAEGDWSAASYWYEAVALSDDPEACIELPYLYPHSVQGDSVVQQYFRALGVATEYDVERDLMVLTKLPAAEVSDEPLALDLNGTPDLTQTLVVTCAMLRRPFRFTGLHTLHIKETDRIDALRTELQKFGITLGVIGNDTLYIDRYPEGAPSYDGRPIATYHDHRMALAFAPAAITCPGVVIAGAEVVTKSYPYFWKTLERITSDDPAD